MLTGIGAKLTSFGRIPRWLVIDSPPVLSLQ